MPPRSLLWFALILMSCGTAPKDAQQVDLVIKDVSVIDVIEGVTRHLQRVHVFQDRIVFVGDEAGKPVPHGARVLEASGHFLIPGLWDMHTHFTTDSTTLDLFLAHGIVGARDMGAIVIGPAGDTVEYVPREEAIDHTILIRDQIRQGQRKGPLIYTPGMILQGADPDDPAAPGLPYQITIASAADAQTAVAMLARKNVDFIKVHALLTPETFQAIVDAAKAHGLAIAGHTPWVMDPVVVSQAGIRSIEHMTGLWEYAHKAPPREELTESGYHMPTYLAEIDTFKKYDVWQVPTLVSYYAGAQAYRVVNDPDSEPALDLVVPELALSWISTWAKEDFSPQQSREFSESVATLQEMVAVLHREHVPIMAGSDFVGICTYPGVSLHKELELLNEAGLSPMETIRTASRNPARFLGIDSLHGSVAEGMVADLVLLRSDPLADIRNTMDIAAVVCRGELYDQARIDALIAKAKQRATPTRELMKTREWRGADE